MRKMLTCSLFLVLVAALTAAPVIPGTLHPVRAKDGDQQIKAEPNDMVEVRIPNPVLPKRVSDVDVEIAGDAKLGGVVNTSDPKLVGSDRISIFVGLKSVARSGEVIYSYKDGGGTKHKGKILIQVIKKAAD